MSDSTVSVVSDKIIDTTKNISNHFFRSRRVFSKFLLKNFYSLLTNTRIEGIENIPENGPLLVLPNHLSNLDGPLVLGLYPHALEMVGPRDFKMEPFKAAMMAFYGMTLIKRGYADSEAVSGIIRHLRNKKHLLMFPSGGMWEKREFKNKSGATYFSQLTQTPILPVGISGAYLKSHGTLTFHKPDLVLRFGKVIDPISKKGSKSEREAHLNEANEQIEKIMFDLLEPEDQERYKRWSREDYGMEIRFQKNGSTETLHSHKEGVLPTLAEFAIKPNLFRPMWKHAKKNMDPLLVDKFYTPDTVAKCARDLHENLTGTFSHYLPYRLGDEAQEKALEEIAELQKICDEAEAKGAQLSIQPTAHDPQSGESRTAPKE